jgi:serine phosphatase RsbU (regulator of sigma subunit)
MAQLRNALRAQLFAGAAPAEALNQLNAFAVHMMPRAFATVLVARVELESGRAEAASAGHLMPFVVDLGGSVIPAPIELSPPIGVRGLTYEPSEFTIEPGQGLVMFSDGLVERRRSTIDDGLDRLAAILDGAGNEAASWISTAMASRETDDDVTIVTLRRD